MTTSARLVLAEIRDSTLSIDEVVAAVTDSRAGAVAVFIGYVRDHDHGEAVDGLDYSCHPTAAVVARDVADRLTSRRGTIRIAVVHRTGHLTVGDMAIVAAVSAEHRAESFEVCRQLVDDFKARVPIWKHQVFTDGSDEWVGLP